MTCITTISNTTQHIIRFQDRKNLLCNAHSYTMHDPPPQSSKPPGGAAS